MSGSIRLDPTYNEKSTFDKVTEHRAYRHTVGRITAVVEAPIDAIAFMWNLLKTSGKLLICPFVHLVGLVKPIQSDEWKIRGVGTDALITLLAGKVFFISLKNIIVAPPTKHSFLNNMEALWFPRIRNRDKLSEENISKYLWSILKGDREGVNKRKNRGCCC